MRHTHLPKELLDPFAHIVRRVFELGRNVLGFLDKGHLDVCTDDGVRTELKR